MPINQNGFQFEFSGGGGGQDRTLYSSGLYHNPPVNEGAPGIRGVAGRAYNRTVGADELVENRLTNLTSRGNPYIANARARGLSQAARRGLGNSSIAAGAAERAAIESALPIAATDAATFAQAQGQNLEALNANLMQERDIANKAIEAGAAQRAAMIGNVGVHAQAAAAQQAAIQMQRERLAFEGEQAGLDRAQQTMLSNLGYGQDLGRMAAGFGYDIGRAGFGAQTDLTRLGYQFRLQGMENDRDVYRQMALQDNQFSNQRYNTAYQSLLDANIGTSNAAFATMLNLFMDDPSIDPRALDGVYQWSTGLGDQRIDDLLSFFLGGGF